jgi:putative flippase GtrA
MVKNQIRSFIIVGIVNTIIGLSSVYFLFNILGINYWPSTFFGNGIGMFLSFYLNKKFTFQSQGKTLRNLFKFFVVVIACYYLSYWLGIRLSNWVIAPFTMNSKVIGNVSILLGAGLYTITNFIGQKYLVFNSSNTVNNNHLGAD